MGEIDTYYGYFYRGTDLEDLVYFTTGPDYMKDIRLVDMKDGTIGVFSRPRNKEIEEKYGLKTTAIVTMAEVVEYLYNKEYKGKVVIDDTIKAAIDRYYEQYGA